MAKLFATLVSDRGVEKHQIANEELTAKFFYGSREKSIHALTVRATVVPDPKGTQRCPEKVIMFTTFVTPLTETISTEEFPLCKTEVVV